ncbi:UNVERIFIED_CONTAM: hypothetical protein PYX00_007991 [Menopon gallinae]|uniref:MTOR-associated protein MEAK7 n=1 Tax=Menopon gallinae TaxID=328185 RepID=A0AAW2HLF6_9NEOP
MGNNNGKKSCTNAYDLKLEQAFSSISNGASTIPFASLKKSWTSKIDHHLYNILESYLKKVTPKGLTKEAYKNLFIDLSNSDGEEKAKCILKVISNGEHVGRFQLLEFLVSILKTVLIIQETKSVKNFKSWRNRSSPPSERSITLFGQYYLNLVSTDTVELDWKDIKTIFVQFDLLLSMVLAFIYETEEDEYYAHLLPRWKYVPMESGRILEDISILNLVKIIFLNSELPIDYQDEWRLLFSSAINGESFSRLTGQIINKGPTIIIIKDKEGHVFGGFAPSNWSMNPNFVGDSRSFLFTLLPSMKVHPATGFNSNFQYMNVGQQTMPNGLGMGGKLEYFGLWLSADYGKGYCSESCTTYRNYKMMSGTKDFTVSHVEVWGVGPPPPTAAELGERSVLDGNVEAQAILELAGKTKYSEGLREEPKD